MNDRFAMGIDAGSSFVKGVLLSTDNAVVARHVEAVGVDFMRAATACRDQLIGQCREAADAVVVATGYGRDVVPFTDRSVTEISCQARGVGSLFAGPLTIVDVGGQDTKVIRTADGGRLLTFTLNRKCAAGTGAFVEEMAHRLGVDAAQLDQLASRGRDGVKISSYCTVFARSELVSLAREGATPQDLALAVYDAVATRVIEMESLDGELVLTGGVAQHHPMMIRRLAAAVGRDVRVPEHPWYTGALGAALFAQAGQGNGRP